VPAVCLAALLIIDRCAERETSWLALHESGSFVRFTLRGADLFA